MPITDRAYPGPSSRRHAVAVGSHRMSGYVATARIRGARARGGTVTARGGVAERVSAVPWPTATSLAAATVEPAADDAQGGAMFGAQLRWAAVRERWSQLTFYLFSPNSWR